MKKRVAMRIALLVLCCTASAKAQSTEIYHYNVTSYAANGNVNSYDDTINGSWSFGYDSLNRLHTGTATTGPYSGSSITWNYDSFGNRTHQAVSGSSAVMPLDTSIGVDSNNRLTSINNGGVVSDANGNLQTDGRYVFAYDAENRICAVYDSITTGNITQYLYDASGRRIAKGHPTQPTTTPVCTTGVDFIPTEKYILDQDGAQVTQLNGSDEWQRTNIFAGGQLIATYDQQTAQNPIHFNVTDALGTKRIQANASGAPEISCLSLPFGDGPLCAGTGVEAIAHRFTGKERDAESGLDYFASRHYGSSIGRWNGADLINVTEERMMSPSNTLNKYAYGGNNPLKFIDLDGRDITVFYDHAGFGGHAVLFAYNQDTHESAVNSFGPDHSRSNLAETAISMPVPGQENYALPKTPDQLRKDYTAITIRTSPEVTQQVINFINGANSRSPASYTTYWRNCTTTCAKILRQIGFYNGYPLIPRDLFADLYSKFGDKRIPTHFGWNKFNNGVDYGYRRQGYDAFDQLGMMECHQERVTVTINMSGQQVISPWTTRCAN